jgi:hypothetical protein
MINNLFIVQFKLIRLKGILKQTNKHVFLFLLFFFYKRKLTTKGEHDINNKTIAQNAL